MTTAVASDIGAHLASQLARTLGANRYERWFRDVQLELEAQRLTVNAPNRCAADLIGRHCRGELAAAAAALAGRPVEIEIIASPAAPAQPAQRDRPDAAAAPPAARPANGPRQAALRHRLDDFVVGQSNHMAYDLARRVAEQPVSELSPLVIHGGCGVGKTHLLQGLCRRYAQAQSARRGRYMTAEQFTNDYIQAVRAGQLGALRAKLRRLDLLAIDDVQFLANKTGTQSEFLHTFDALKMAGGTVVMAADVHPKRMGEFSERLLSRFVSGMVVQIHAPDTPTRHKLIAELARRRGLALRDGVVESLAAHCGGSVRDIQGKLNLLEAITRDPQRHPSDGTAVVGHAMIDRLLGASGTVRPARPIRFDDIFDTVCEAFAVERAAVLSGRRQKLLVLARSLAAYLARRMTPMSYPEIARALKRPNHTTIITACQRTESQIESGLEVHLPTQQRRVTLGDLAEELRRAILAAAR